MFKWFNDLKISSKFIIISLIMIGLIIFVSVVVLINQNNIKLIVMELIEVDSQIAKLNLQSQNAILLTRQYEKNYFLYYKQHGFKKSRTKYIESLQKQIEAIHIYLEEILYLENNHKIKKHLEKQQKDLYIFDKIEHALVQYESSVLATVELIEIRGFKDEGLEGIFRKSVHAIEEMVQNKKLPLLIIDLLMMRRYEKDFLLRNDKQYIDKLHQKIHNFKINIAATQLAQKQKNQLNWLTEQYQLNFDKLVQINTEITQQVEIYTKFSYELESLFEKILVRAIEDENLAKINVQKQEQKTLFITLFISIIAVIIGMIIVFIFVNLLSKPLNFIMQVSQLLIAGNTTLEGIDRDEMEKLLHRKDEIGDIGRAFNTISQYFKAVIDDITRVSQGLAVGNLQITTASEYRGDFVQIENALKSTVTSLQVVINHIIEHSEMLAEGNLEHFSDATYSGDFKQIHHALESATMKLTTSKDENAVQNWLKSGQTQLSTLMGGDQSIKILAKNVITYLTVYTDAQIGLFYQLKHDSDKDYLQMVASYAFTANENSLSQFKLGEGLVGQTALEKKVISISQTVEECPIVVRSGLAGALPRHVLLLPILYEELVLGVIEIGSNNPLTQIQQNFLEQVVSNIGIAMNMAESRTQMQLLLEKTQHQAESLKTQQVELQQKQTELQENNAELQNQSEELQSQQEELQNQQEELRQTNESLEDQTRDLRQQKSEIQQKNQSLEQNQTELEQAKSAIEAKAEQLESASRYKSEFLANMSHELRTPLNSVLILAKLLSENKANNLNDKQVEYAQTIHSAGSDLLQLINEILDLSKIEAGKTEVHLDTVLLRDLIKNIKQKFYPLAENNSTNFDVTFDDNVSDTLQTDQQKLRQILNNLLSNAFKFTKQGKVQLTIQKNQVDELPVVLQTKKIPFISFKVLDTGIGIPTDKQQVIFEAFQQADGSTNRSYGGTGLGLSISRQLSQLLGGDLTLESQENKGSQFTLYLPLEIVAETNQVAFIVNSETSTKITEPTKPIKDDRENLQPKDKIILIIEDDNNFANIVIDLVRENGFKCLAAGDGKMGLVLVDKYHPNVIILDIGLPKLDGWSVMERLKDNVNTRHIPVYFMSGSDQDIEAKKRGAIGYLNKPIGVDKLQETFKHIEAFLTKTIKQVLIISDNDVYQQQIIKLVGNKNVETTIIKTIANALQQLNPSLLDCIILDAEIEQRKGVEFCKQIYHQQKDRLIPIIFHSEKDLSVQEEHLLQRYASHLIIKIVKSPERLLEEATLFLHQAEAELPVEKRNMLKMVHDKEAILKNKKVLIVDDDVRNAFALVTFLEEKDMRIAIGNNGKEGLELLEQHSDIDLILMDIMMPEMDGYETIKHIRKKVGYRHIPIIALTAKAMKGDKNKCIEAGANDYLTKPVDTEKLLSLMRVWLYQ